MRMKFSTALGKSILPAIGGYLLGGYVASLLFAAFLRMGDGTALERWLRVPVNALGLYVYALLATALPMFVLGWPIYALLFSSNKATWLTVTLMALVLAALWMIPEPVIGGLVALYGLCVMWTMHALRLRFVRAPEMARGT